MCTPRSELCLLLRFALVAGGLSGRGVSVEGTKSCPLSYSLPLIDPPMLLDPETLRCLVDHPFRASGSSARAGETATRQR